VNYFRAAAESAVGKRSLELVLNELLRLSALKHPRVASTAALADIEGEEE
jgi:hypothetical protein